MQLFPVVDYVNGVKRLLLALAQVERIMETYAISLQYKLAAEFMPLLIGNIMTQKYASGYAAYHPKYAAWKQQYAATTGFWVLKGDLVRNIQIWRKGDGYSVGIPAGVMDSGGKSWNNWSRGYARANLGATTPVRRRPDAAMSKRSRGAPKEIGWYASIMEFGLRGVQKHPARPVFTPTTDEYANTMWPKAIAEMRLALARRLWRWR